MRKAKQKRRGGARADDMENVTINMSRDELMAHLAKLKNETDKINTTYMGTEELKMILKEGHNITISMTAQDLKAFAEDIAISTARSCNRQTVQEIKEAMGDSMKYCSAAEAMKLLGVKSRGALLRREESGQLTPLFVNGRKSYLRDEVIGLQEKAWQRLSRQNLAK